MDPMLKFLTDTLKHFDPKPISKEKAEDLAVDMALEMKREEQVLEEVDDYARREHDLNK